MQRGFSLVELSIVLVILGLLTGGILAGQSLIRAAELRAVTTEFNRYVAATNTFRDKYFALPGDMSSATKFWTRLSSVASCVTNSGASVGSPGACDGDGDGLIEYTGGGANTSSERFQFWRQLALAGLIEGNYAGMFPASVPPNFVVGGNIPGSKISNAAWDVQTAAQTSDPSFTDMSSRTVMLFGGYQSSSSPFGAILKPEEAWNIDTKMDDGKPATGKIWAVNYSTCSTAADSTDLTGSYKLTSSSLACALEFLNPF